MSYVWPIRPQLLRYLSKLKGCIATLTVSNGEILFQQNKSLSFTPAYNADDDHCVMWIYLLGKRIRFDSARPHLAKCKVWELKLIAARRLTWSQCLLGNLEHLCLRRRCGGYAVMTTATPLPFCTGSVAYITHGVSAIAVAFY